MKALTWQGKRSVSVEEVPDAVVQYDTDAVIRVTSAAICGSDLHLYEVFGAFLDKGDVLGHETMGVVTALGSAVTGLEIGDRVVIPFNISCGVCFMCTRGLQSQCETTQVTEMQSGASLFGFTKLYGQIPGGQAELLRVPIASYNTIKVGADLPDERYLFLSDILPTAWQGVQYADVPEGGSLVVLGLGPVGQFAARIGTYLGYEVYGVDPVPERRALAAKYGVTVFDLDDEVVTRIRALTGDRGPDSVLDAVGLEAHDSPGGKFAQTVGGLLPDAVSRKFQDVAGVDRLAALHLALDLVRRGGTVSLSGVYAGEADPMPMKSMFDKQVNLRMGQCNVKRWIDDLMPIVEDPADPLGIMDLVTHRAPLEDAPHMYDIFQKKEDGCIKVVLQPGVPA